MPAATKLNTVAPLAQLEIAGKLISENLQADAARVPDLDNALVIGGGALLNLLTMLFPPLMANSRRQYQLCILLRRAVRCLASVCQSQNNPTAACAAGRIKRRASFMWDGLAAGDSCCLYCDE